MTALEVPPLLRVRVHGIPAPQGSKRAFVVNGKARLVEAAGDRHKTWRTDIIEQTRAQLPDGWTPITGPVAVGLVFFQAPPKSLTKRERALPPDRGNDIDKLIRAVFDAMTVAQVWNDDKRAVSVYALKAWADEVNGPGVDIRVSPLA